MRRNHATGKKLIRSAADSLSAGLWNIISGMASAPPPPVSGLGRTERIVLATALIAVSALYLLMSSHRFYFLEGASAGDILLAQALARGEGFRETWRIGRPPCTVRPPGLAFLFSILIRLSSGQVNMLLLTMVNNLFGPLSFLAAFLLIFRRTRSFRTALGLSWFCAALPFSIEISRHLYSGAAFSTLLLFSLWIFESAEEEEFRSRWKLLAFLLLSATAFLVRSIGLAVPLAAVASLPGKNKIPAGRRLAWILAIIATTAIVPGGWTLRNYMVKGGQDQPYFSKLLAGEPRTSLYWLAEDQGIPLLPKPRPLTPRRALLRLQENTGFYLDETAPFLLPALAPLPKIILRLVSAAFLLPVLFGLLRQLLLRPRISELTALATLGIMWTWPFPHPRFSAPVLPLLLLAFYENVIRATSIRQVRSHGQLRFRTTLRRAFILLGIAVLGLNLKDDLRHLRQRFQPPPYHLTRTPGMVIVANRPQTSHSLYLLDFIRQNTPRSAVIMFHSLAPCGLVAQRVCAAPPIGSPETVMKYIDENHVDFVVADNEKGAWGAAYFSYRYLLPAIERFPERFSAVARVPSQVIPPEQPAVLYKVIPLTYPPDSP